MSMIEVFLLIPIFTRVITKEQKSFNFYLYGLHFCLIFPVNTQNSLTSIGFLKKFFEFLMTLKINRILPGFRVSVRTLLNTLRCCAVNSTTFPLILLYILATIQTSFTNQQFSNDSSIITPIHRLRSFVYHFK